MDPTGITKKTFFPTQVDMLAVIANSSRPLLQSAMRNLQEFGNLDAEKRAQADDPNQERSQGHHLLRFHKNVNFSKQSLGGAMSNYSIAPTLDQNSMSNIANFF